MRKLVILYFMLPIVQNAQQHSQARIPNSVVCAAAEPVLTITMLCPSSFTLTSGHTSPSPLLCLLEVYM